VYIKDAYQHTFYLDTREINEVNIVIGMYNDKLTRKKKRKEEWDKFYSQICNLFSVRYNQPILDQIKAKEKKEFEKKQIKDLENIKIINQIEQL
jgi:hypothetical protein